MAQFRCQRFGEPNLIQSLDQPKVTDVKYLFGLCAKMSSSLRKRVGQGTLLDGTQRHSTLILRATQFEVRISEIAK